MFRRYFLLSLLLPVIMLAGCEGVLKIESSKPTIKSPCIPDEGCNKDCNKDCYPTREILFFTMRGCPPCEKAKPQVEAIRRQGVKITEVDYYANPELVRKYNITKTPTFIVLEDGVEIERTSSITALILMLVKILAIVLPLLLG